VDLVYCEKQTAIQRRNQPVLGAGSPDNPPAAGAVRIAHEAFIKERQRNHGDSCGKIPDDISLEAARA
jgi:hypothetical protein